MPRSDRPGPSVGSPDESSVLSALEATVRGAVFSPADSLDVDRALAEVGADAALLLVRTAAPATPVVGATVAMRSLEDLELARESAACFADGALLVPASRALGVLSGSRDVAALEASLSSLGATTGEAVAEPGPLRLAQAMRRVRARAPHATLLVQRLDERATFGLVVSRDTRTGVASLRTTAGRSPRGLLDPLGTPRALAEAGLSPHLAAELEDIVRSLEAQLALPVRVAFEVVADELRVVGVSSQRRVGRVACAPAVDLVERGALDVPAALGLVEPRDLLEALPARVAPDEVEVLALGISAGVGVAEGHACLDPQKAESFARAGLSPVLIVHGVDAEDAHSLRASVAVVCVRGGITGEAAVMARALGKPCIASGPSLTLRGDRVEVGGAAPIFEGDRVTVEATRGRLLRGSCVRQPEDASPDLAEIVRWIERPGCSVIASVRSAADVSTAVRYRADGVALLAPEPLYFDALRSTEAPHAALLARFGEVLAAAPPHLGRVTFRLAPCSGFPGAPLPAGSTSAELLGVAVDALLDAAASAQRAVEVVLPADASSLVREAPADVSWAAWVGAGVEGAVDRRFARLFVDVAAQPTFEPDRAHVLVGGDVELSARRATRATNASVVCSPEAVLGARLALARAQA